MSSHHTKRGSGLLKSAGILLAICTLVAVFRALVFAATDVQTGLGGNEPTTLR